MHIAVCNTNPYIIILAVVIFAKKCIFCRVLSYFYLIKSLAVPLHCLNTFSVIPCSAANEDVISASTRNLPSILLITAWIEKEIMNGENTVEKKLCKIFCGSSGQQSYHLYVHVWRIIPQWKSNVPLSKRNPQQNKQNNQTKNLPQA